MTASQTPSRGPSVTQHDESGSTQLLRVPGCIIAHRKSAGGEYIGSPSIAILPDGTYVASHDVFGPGTNEFNAGVVFIYRSEDRGATWREIARIEPAFWANLFVHSGSLYLFGTTHHHGPMAIRRSDDGGYTWTTPRDEMTGLLSAKDSQFHTAPVPMLVHAGRLWRAMEDAGPGGAWGERYQPVLMSSPVNSDLLHRESWTLTNPLPRSREWLNGSFGGMLEGNVVLTPSGRLANLLRVALPDGEKAALALLSLSGVSLEFSAENDFVDLPGGATKFTVRRDPESGYYWTLSNWVPSRYAGSGNASLVRNTLALFRSRDLRHWELRSVVLHHPDAKRRGFQYVDWLFDGEDLIAVSRTGYDDAYGGAKKAHDANYLTFHRIEGFRALTANDTLTGELLR